jgi:CRP-like cAMP-binding protein
LSDKDFVGKNCLAGERLRTESARAMTDCILLRIERKIMIRILAREVGLSNILCQYLLKQNLRYRRALVDNRCNPSEKRVPHILLSLANFDGKTKG